MKALMEKSVLRIALRLGQIAESLLQGEGLTYLRLSVLARRIEPVEYFGLH
jgi:hypothetical protein